ncbi:MAG: TonB-dependent receptor [Acidobacteria bacterium]|nr:TonB-dependent receptor [Acidobacteriota bacterium]
MNGVLCHRKASALCVGILLGLCFNVHPTRGQTAATISGTVHDATGAVLPGVSIAVESTETGRSQESVSDDQGRYRVAGLPAGAYRVVASLPGFKKAVRGGIQLTVAQSATVDLSLQIGEIAEEVTVQGEAPLVDTTVSSVSGVITTTQMTELPLNGRDFTQLSLLETGTVNVRNTGQDVNKGFGTRVSSAGSRPEQTGYMLDGTDVNNFLNFQAPGSAANVILGVDAIREFRVEVSNFTAEYGRSTGAILNMVSKSGTNEIHGTLFEFLRNDNLDARNFFAIPNKPEFKRNQFGASLGGPLVKNRTFFFTNYEGLRQIKGLSKTAFVLDENARRGFLPAPGGGLREVGVAQTVRPVIQELYPLPNGPSLGGGVATYYNVGKNEVHEDYWTLKVDHEFSQRSRFFVRYNFDDAALQNPYDLPNFLDLQISRTQYLTLEQSSSFSPNLLNVGRFAYNRSLIKGDAVPLHPISVTFRTGVPLWLGGSGTGIGIGGGISNTGGRDIRGGVQNLFQYIDNVYYTRGGNSLKFGFNLERIQNNNDLSRYGSWSFDNLEAFLRGIPQSISLAMGPGSDGIRGYRQWLMGMYFQDDWRISSHLTMNLGVRWEFYTVPREVNGKVANLRSFNDTTTTVGDPWWKNPSLDNVAPRLGLAWDPRGDGKTVVRAGYGLFFQMITPPAYRVPGTRTPPFYINLSVQNPPPDLFPYIDQVYQRALAEGRPQSVTQPVPIQFHLNSAYEQKFNLTLSRQIFSDTVLTLGYLGGRGTHLIMLVEANQPRSARVNGRWVIPAGAPRPYPQWSSVSYGKSDGQSFYHGLQVKLDRRFSSGFQGRVSYTLSKNIDDGTTTNFFGASDYAGEGRAHNPDNVKGDRGLSKLDSRHTFTVSGLYQLPVGSGLPGVARAVLGGWMLSGIVSLSSGTPFWPSLGISRHLCSVCAGTVPDLAPGASENPIREGNPNQYLDLSAFGIPPANTYGNLGRNTLIGPGFANLDLALSKQSALSRISENLSLQFRVEVFNVLNRAQFGHPSSSLFTTATARNPLAGRIESTTAENRQVQFGLKFIW